MNKLYYGDNLKVLRNPDYFASESVDLVYLDPPFNSKANYNVLFKEQDGSRAASQMKAFNDTWTWDQEAVRAYEETVEAGGKVSEAMQGFYKLLGGNDMMAYLAMMAPRLVELHRVLKPTGSLYIHCDPTASHYLKVLLDAIFKPVNFRNEIIWRRTGAHNPQRQFGPIHDVILFYVKSNDYFFNIVKRPYMAGHVKTRYSEDASGKMKFTSGGNILTGAGATGGESGKTWKGFDPSKKNRHWAVPGFLAEQMPPEFQQLGVLDKLDALYDAGLVEIVEGAAWPTPVRFLAEDDGHPLQDIWAYQPYTEKTVHGTESGIDEDVAWLGPTDPERLGYQTQKPLGLLRRIIKASCPDGGTVLDPFCGCGTAVIAAQEMDRPWKGIDITQAAIVVIKERLKDAFGGAAVFKVVGEPETLPDAEKLAKEDPYQFQWWSLGLVGARPVEKKKGADRGIDGRLNIHDEAGGKTKQIILSVKGGLNVGVKDVRDLISVVDREKAVMGVLISLAPATKPMRTEAAEAGTYHSPWGTNHPKIQIITIEELLDGRVIDAPATRQTSVTFAKAKRSKAPMPKNRMISFEELDQFSDSEPD